MEDFVSVFMYYGIIYYLYIVVLRSVNYVYILICINFYLRLLKKKKGKIFFLNSVLIIMVKCF